MFVRWKKRPRTKTYRWRGQGRQQLTGDTCLTAVLVESVRGVDNPSLGRRRRGKFPDHDDGTSRRYQYRSGPL